MPDTWFTVPPDWTLYIIPYFYIGGIAGGAYFLAVLLDWFGRPEDRPIVRMGYYTAMIGAMISAVILIVDLTVPLRFWHMIVQSENFPMPMLKWWSPMSIGSWALLFFGGFATLSAIGAWHEAGRIHRFGFLSRGPLARAIQAAGAFFALFIAGYTGVLLAVTNRPVWADSNFVGLLFLLSGASTAAATLVLLGRRHRQGSALSERFLGRFEAWVLMLEVLVVVIFLVSLGPAIQAWLNVWGLILILGAVGLGQLLPLALHYRPAWFRHRIRTDTVVASAIFVLVGGFLLRASVIMVSHVIDVHSLTHVP